MEINPQLGKRHEYFPQYKKRPELLRKYEKPKVLNILKVFKRKEYNVSNNDSNNDESHQNYNQSPPLGEPRKWTYVNIPEQLDIKGGQIPDLFSTQTQDLQQELVSEDKGRLRALLRLASRNGMDANCEYYNGMFSNGNGTAFCAIGALAHEYCGWDGKSSLCPTDGKYYISIPTWTTRALQEILSLRVYEHIMLVNDGAKKQNGYAPVIEYLKGLGL